MIRRNGQCKERKGGNCGWYEREWISRGKKMARVLVYVGMYRDIFHTLISSRDDSLSKLSPISSLHVIYVYVGSTIDLLYLTQFFPRIAPPISLDPWTSDGRDQEAFSLTVSKRLYVYIECENMIKVASKNIFHSQSFIYTSAQDLFFPLLSSHSPLSIRIKQAKHKCCI